MVKICLSTFLPLELGPFLSLSESFNLDLCFKVWMITLFMVNKETKGKMKLISLQMQWHLEHKIYHQCPLWRNMGYRIKIKYKNQCYYYFSPFNSIKWNSLMRSDDTVETFKRHCDDEICAALHRRQNNKDYYSTIPGLTRFHVHLMGMA